MNRSIAVMVVAVFASCTSEERGGGSGPSPGGGGSVEQQNAPLTAFRPVVGGHLSVSADGRRILVADPEREQLHVLSSTGTTIEDVALPAGSWPVRVIEIAPDQFQVLLRGTGQLATVTRTQNQPTTVVTVDVCAEPRGLTRDANATLVSCAGGELVRVGAEVTRESFPFEWRDVVVKANGQVVGTSFRSAQLIDVGARVARPLEQQRVVVDATNPTRHVPRVAWRTLRDEATSSSFVIHQLHADQLTTTPPSMPTNPQQPPSSPYGGGGSGGGGTPGIPASCSAAAVVTGITRVLDNGNSFTAHTNDILPVDAALSPDGSMLAIVGAGGSGLSVYPTSLVQGSNGCMMPTGGVGGLALTSVAWLSDTKLVVLESLRSSPMLFDVSSGLARPLGTDRPLASPAHSIFHQSPRGGAALACASCHPEGGEDGHVWSIDGTLRRTQTLAGGVMSRQPFHWRGDLDNLSALMGDTFVKRMGATPVTSTELTGLASWLDTIPAPKASRVLTAELRAAGLAAFDKAACSGCHLRGGLDEGPAADIGTGEAVRSPSLQGVVARAPYLHTGEIPDLRTRVTGTLHPNHGNLARLSTVEKESLLAYLESL
jgi:mono/diheme cytochrome c family protein